MTSQNPWPRYDRRFVGIHVLVTWQNVWSWWANIYRVVSLKFNAQAYENVRVIIKLANKAYLSDITVVNISESFTPKMAAKTSWHRHESKLRHCRPMYNVVLLITKAITVRSLLRFAFEASS